MRVHIKSYGCKASYDDSSIIVSLLKKEGYQLSSLKESDIVIIQTCVVKDSTNDKINHQLNKLYKKKKLIISGCMAESQYQRIKKLYPQAGIINTFHTTKILEVVNSLNSKPLHLTGKRNETKLNLPKKYNKIASIQIAQGCSSLCYFCETKLAKGYIQSQSIEEIKRELKTIINKGIKQINITSTDNGCYGQDIKTDLPNLINELTKISGNFKLRIGMMNPEHVKKYYKKLIQTYKSNKVFPFIHLPLQSGSDKILKLMNRKYTIKEFKEIINSFKKEFPNITIATDIIVGYPGETQEDFQKTIKIIKELNFEVLNISKFSARPNTIAAKQPKLPVKIIQERSNILHKQYKTRQETREEIIRWI